VRDVNLRRRPPILSWDQTRDILKEKYVPAYYMNNLLNQFLNLKQNTSTNTEYMSPFEALMLRCEVDEEHRFIVSRFVNGLRADIKCEVKVHPGANLYTP